MKEYQFRAAYFKEKDGDIEYSSMPIRKARKICDTVGIYEKRDNDEEIEKAHVLDMSLEDFRHLLDLPFPNGFDSWRKTHFEITRILTYERIKEEKNLSEALAKIRSSEEYDVLVEFTHYLTDMFEKQYASEAELKQFDLIRFVDSKLKELDTFFKLYRRF